MSLPDIERPYRPMDYKHDFVGIEDYGNGSEKRNYIFCFCDDPRILRNI